MMVRSPTPSPPPRSSAGEAGYDDFKERGDATDDGLENAGDAGDDGS